jgi:hypothetical protein
MKTKTKVFGVGKSTYFHHQHGVYLRKNRKRNMAISLSIFTVMFGGFFIGREYAWPLIQNNSGFQRVQEVASNNIVSAQTKQNNKNAEPIRTEDELLTSVLRDKIETFPSDQKWSVFVYDLNTERTAEIGSHESYSAASLYKLFLLEALEAKLPHDQWQWTWVGGQSISSCVEEMLKTTDSPCAQELGDFIGWDKIESTNKASGFKKTKLAGNGRETTVSDVGELLAKLKKGQMLSDYARRSVFDALYQQTPNKGIAKGCKNCRTANKQGELSNIAHDAGIVTHGKHSYVLVVMSEGGSFNQISELAKLVELQFAPGRR